MLETKKLNTKSISNWISNMNRTTVKKWLFLFVMLILWSEVLLNISRLGMVEFQIFRDTFFFRASALLLVIVCIWRKIKIYQLKFIFPASVYCAFAIRDLVVNKYEIDYFNFLLYRYIMYGLVLIVFVDLIFSQNKNQEQKYEKPLVFLMALAFSFALFYDKEGTLPVVLVFVPFYLTGLGEKEKKQNEIVFSIAMVLSTYWLILKSLVEQPDNYLWSGRYVGNFMYTSTCGIISAIGLIGALSLFVCFKDSVKKKWVLALVMLAVASLPLYLLIISFNRISVAAVLFVLAVAVFAYGELSPKIKKVVLGVVAICVALGIGCLLFVFFYSKKLSMNSSLFNNSNNNLLHFIEIRLNYIGTAESTMGLFEEGSFLNFLDRFTSGRLTLGALAFKKMGIWGNSDISVLTPNGRLFSHVHCTYLNWLIQFGYIGGGFFLCWLVCVVRLAIKKIKSKETEVTTLALWVSFSLVFFMAEVVFIQKTVMFILLIVLYQLIRKNGENNGEKCELS